MQYFTARERYLEYCGELDALEGYSYRGKDSDTDNFDLLMHIHNSTEERSNFSASELWLWSEGCKKQLIQLKNRGE